MEILEEMRHAMEIALTDLDRTRCGSRRDDGTP
jgi:hypothetical protein